MVSWLMMGMGARTGSGAVTGIGDGDGPALAGEVLSLLLADINVPGTQTRLLHVLPSNSQSSNRSQRKCFLGY